MQDVREGSEPPRDDGDRSSTLAVYLKYSHVGVQFFLSVGLFTWGGIWLDGRLGTVVLFTLTGLALGFTGGLYALYRELVLKRAPEGENSAEKGSRKNESRGNSPSNPDKPT